MNLKKESIAPFAVLIGAIFALVLTIGVVSATERYVGPGETYTTIQAAVTAANPNDTIIVRDDTYTENVAVNVTNLTLRSENGSAFTTVTAAQPTSDVFLVTANSVTITGFSVRNATAASGIRLDSVHHCTISGNNASSNCVGISVDYSTNNNITNNTAYNSSNHGFYIESSSNNSISGNEASYNQWNGFFISLSNDNTISGNRVYNNPDYGIYLSSSNNNTITGNYAYNNSYYGISLDHSSNNTILSNAAYNNSFNGIYLCNSCNNNSISHNAAYNNDGGIVISSSNNNNLTDNTVSNNSYDGISISDSSNTRIVNNTASGNSCGFHLESADHTILKDNTGCNNSLCGFEIVASKGNLISGNDLHHSQVGISLLVRCDDNRIVNNSVYDNTGAGIDLRSDCNNITITGNHVYNNSDGISIMAVTTSTVSDNFVYNNSRIGIYLWLFGTSDDIISGNKIYGNGDGIILRNSSSSSSTNCSGNDIYSNDWGIKVQESNTVAVFSNIVTNNIYGIYLWLNSSNNLIYNNYFDNSQNAYDNGLNIWNITQTQGTNIIGGSWLGGNYWSDYTGTDKNGDGIGDTLLPHNSSGGIQNGGDWLPLVAPAFVIFDTGKGTYPAIPGTHNGTITPFYDITVSKLYTYPCAGTGGHTEYVKLWNSTDWTVTATWVGYNGDWHNLSFNNTCMLYANATYNYTIHTGSYPQIIHEQSWNATGGVITCEEFVDTNGKRHDGWIPAIRLS